MKTCVLHALCDERSALLTSQSTSLIAVAFEPSLVAMGIVQLN